jgi:hypothetical protein
LRDLSGAPFPFDYPAELVFASVFIYFAIWRPFGAADGSFSSIIRHSWGHLIRPAINKMEQQRLDATKWSGVSIKVNDRSVGPQLPKISRPGSTRSKLILTPINFFYVN